jgi:hypothetical protein
MRTAAAKLTNINKLTLKVCYKSTLLACLLSAVFFGPSFAENPAEIEVVGATFDFGYVPYGVTVKQRVKLINHGDSILRITKLIPGCGCTRMSPDRWEALSGESLFVDLFLDTKKIGRGHFQKSPKINTNYPSVRRIETKMTGVASNQGDFPLPVELSSKEIVVNRKNPNSTSISIKNVSKDDLTVKLAAAPLDPHVVITLPSTQLTAGRTEVIKVEIDEGTLPDKISDSFTIHFNDIHKTRITIPIRSED